MASRPGRQGCAEQMSASKIPRYLRIILTLGGTICLLLLVLYYLQYRWLTGELISDSAQQHAAAQQQSLERRVRAHLHDIGHLLAAEAAAGDSAESSRVLVAAIEHNRGLIGLRFDSDAFPTLTAGDAPPGNLDSAAAWFDDRLVLRYPLDHDEQGAGVLTGAFLLDDFRQDMAAFDSALLVKEAEIRRASFIFTALGTVATILTLGLITWLIIRRQNKRIEALRVQAEKLRDANFGEPLPIDRTDSLGQLAAVFNDMRDQLRATTISRNFVDSILSGMNEAVIVTSEDGTIRRINKATYQLLGYDADYLVGKSIDLLIDRQRTGSLLDADISGIPREAFLKSNSGETIPVSYTCSVIAGNTEGEDTRIYAAQNITERRRAEQRIRYLARIDALTKIPNRMQFQHLLQRSIARARRAGNSLRLFYIDIDGFKEINDTFGHLAGDATLETVAERLTAALPEQTIIGRLAGDEFAVILKDVGPGNGGGTNTDRIARSLLDRLADPFYVQGHEVFMTASLGIAYYPADAPNVIDLIRNADAALYSAKRNGGNVHAYYQPSMNEAAVERLMTKSKLKRAFERDELLVHYQPKYNLESGEIIGAEALVRWELPERGLILPADFIPLAEETNPIVEIGEWVLDKVCEDFRFWQRSVSSPDRVSVNLSLKQLRQPNFISRINSILRGHEVSPTSLELEITETTLMENPSRTVKLLDQLYALGLHLAIDDFGTGYSSLSALQQFPIGTLKIDRSFVRDMAVNPDDATLVGTIIQMGRNLNLDVVAEGVETEEQLNLLQQLECTYVQGLLFGDPMSSDDFVELLLAQAEGTDTHRALFA